MPKRSMRQLFAFLLTFLVFVLPIAFVRGFDATNPANIVIQNPLGSKANTLPDFINLIITSVILPLGGMIAVVFIIFAGFKMVTARGNETKIKEAKLAFFHAAIGTAILLGSWVIAQVIKTTINSLTGTP